MKTCPNGCFKQIEKEIKQNVPNAVKIKIPEVTSLRIGKREPVFYFRYNKQIRTRITEKEYHFAIAMSYCPHCGTKLVEV